MIPPVATGLSPSVGLLPQGVMPAATTGIASTLLSATQVLAQAVQPVIGVALQRADAGAGSVWGGSLQSVLADAGATAAFSRGLEAGVVQAASGLLTGGGDALGGIGRTADAITSYVDLVARNPMQLGNDVKGWIAGNWPALTADHASAAIRGGLAEAGWWGGTVGRAAFQVASLVVPDTRFASAARAGDVLASGELLRVFAEAARSGRLAELFAAAAMAGRIGELLDAARQAGRLPELADAARATRDGTALLAGPGGLTRTEMALLLRLGVFSPAMTRLVLTSQLAAGRADDVRVAAEQTGLPHDQVINLLATPPAERPLPETYLSEAVMAGALARYDDGAVRLVSRRDYDRFGLLGPTSGGLVVAYEAFVALAWHAGRSRAALEHGLELPPETLADADTMIVRIDRDALDRLRLPSGREDIDGKWLPGGMNGRGLPMAMMDFSPSITGHEICLR